jgi:hypothetical protein
VRTSKKMERFGQQPAFQAGEVDLDDLLHRFGIVGKAMKWKKQRRRKASGSSFSLFEVMITIGRCVGFDRLAGLVDMELHPVELLQEVVRELDVGLVDLVDQQDRALASA